MIELRCTVAASFPIIVSEITAAVDQKLSADLDRYSVISFV